MDDLEVRELRYFVAVAEELNFSRAAERLGMAQPPLSRAIRLMERRLGVELFERKPREVKLTSAGLSLLEEAPRALSMMAMVSRRARRAAEKTPKLVVAAKPGIAANLLRQIVSAFDGLPDTPTAEIIVSAFHKEADMLRDGHADVALLGSPLWDARGLDTEQLTTEPRVAALPAGHVLADRGELRCRDLRGLPFSQWSGLSAAELAYWSGLDVPTSAGAPNLGLPDDAEAGPVVNDGMHLLEVIALGQAVALIPKSLATNNSRPDIVYVPVTDASLYTVYIAWPEGSRATPIAAFVRTAIEVAAPSADVEAKSLVS